MEITVNQQNFSVPENCSVQQVLDTVFLQPVKSIAIAVNLEIISKSNWQTCQLQAGDNVTVIKATQGG